MYDVLPEPAEQTAAIPLDEVVVEAIVEELVEAAEPTLVEVMDEACTSFAAITFEFATPLVRLDFM